MNALAFFENEQFGKIGVIYENNKLYLEAIGVAKALGYLNEHAAIQRHCRYEGVVFREVGVATGIRRDNSIAIQMVRKKFIDEGNLYRLIIKSKLKSAKKFEEWVFDEVLPTIRQEGMYITKEKALEILYKQNLDYTILGKTISRVDDAITVGQFAKILSNKVYVGRNRLYKWFRDSGYLIKAGSDKNMPKQVYLEQGLFKISEKIVNTKDGQILSTKPLITGKGQAYFLKLYLEDYYLENNMCTNSLSEYNDITIQKYFNKI